MVSYIHKLFLYLFLAIVTSICCGAFGVLISICCEVFAAEHDILDCLDDVWILDNRVENIQKALASVPAGNILIALEPNHFIKNKYSWSALLSEARKNDMLVDIDENFTDSRGCKHVRNGFSVINNTDMSRAFIEALFKKTAEKATPTHGHPNLFSSVLAEFHLKEKKAFKFSNLVWPIPLTWVKEPVSASENPIPTELTSLVDILEECRPFSSLLTREEFEEIENTVEQEYQQVSPNVSPKVEPEYENVSPTCAVTEDHSETPQVKAEGDKA
jgi:hypothetical protein